MVHLSNIELVEQRHPQGGAIRIGFGLLSTVIAVSGLFVVGASFFPLSGASASAEQPQETVVRQSTSAEPRARPVRQRIVLGGGTVSAGAVNAAVVEESDEPTIVVIAQASNPPIPSVRPDKQIDIVYAKPGSPDEFDVVETSRPGVPPANRLARTSAGWASGGERGSE